ncbi:MAG: hypothetical protein JXQ75_23620 [Phycisphaerae bacterium]|nr:hypothetical protein [Phycisphaerae bacterium]
MSDEPGTIVPTAVIAAVDGDLPCFFCGYNLRSLALDGVCPECGKTVQEGIRRGWLVFADRGWLARLRTGVTIILWLLLAAILSYIGFVMYMMSMALASVATGPPDPFAFLVAMVVFGLGVSIVWLVSVWYLTTPEPVAGQGPQQSTLATWTRILNVISLCSTVLLVVAFASTGWGIADTATGYPVPPVASLLLLPSIAGGLAGAVGFLLLLIHMRRVARRDSKKGLGKLMTFLVWGAVVMAGVWATAMLFFVGFAGRMAAFTTGPTTTMPVTITGSPAVRARLTALGYLPPTTLPTTAPVATTSPAKQTGAGAAGPVVDNGTIVINGPPWGSPSVTQAAATTMPAGPAAGAPPMPFGGGFMVFMGTMCVTELLAFAWFVAGVVGLFWFRSVFNRAIRENAANVLLAANRPT